MSPGSSSLIKNAWLAEQWLFYCDHYPIEFESLQNRYAFNWYYMPVKRKMWDKLGIDLDARDPVVRGTMYSMSIRSGADSAVAKVSLCTAKTSDKDLLKVAYESYGTSDAYRWTLNGQYGDALEAMKKGKYDLISTGETMGFDAIIKKSGKNYLVQCGVFSQKANAEKLVRHLAEYGFEAIIK